MSLISQTVREFGRSLGIDNLSWNARGLVCLEFESSGSLYLENLGETLLIYLAFWVPYAELNLFIRALSLCHYSRGNPIPVQAGWAMDGRLVFAARIPVINASLPEIQRILDLLLELRYRCVEGE